MSRPTGVVICGRPFKIEYCKKVDSKDSYGESNVVERIIKVKSGLKEEQVEEVILHEILHCILYTAGQSEHLTEEQEEGLVIALENGLFPLFKRDFQ